MKYKRSTKYRKNLSNQKLTKKELKRYFWKKRIWFFKIIKNLRRNIVFKNKYKIKKFIKKIKVKSNNFFSKKKQKTKNFSVKFIKKLSNNKIKNLRFKPISSKNFKHKIKFFRNDVFFFIRKLFNSFLKKGKKYLTINYFLKIFFFICLKIFRGIKVKKTQSVFLYFHKILNNITPVFVYTNLMFRGESMILPWIRKNKKINKLKVLKIAISWIKKSTCKRKEKTLFFKLISELEDLRKNKGESINNKKEYYLNFYDKRYYIKFLRKRAWI